MKAVKVACGQSFSAALMDDGTLWGCGWVGLQGPDAYRGRTMKKIEVCSPLGHIKDVAAGYYGIDVVSEQNEIWGVGNVIVKISESEHVVQIERPLCGMALFALKDDGEVWGFGEHPYTTGYFKRIALPIELEKNVISLAASERRNLALINGDHNLFIGGSNLFGQLGDGTEKNDQTLKCVLHDVQQVEFGGMDTYCLAVTTNDQLYGWGSDWGNRFDQKYGIFTKKNEQNVVVIKNGVRASLFHPQVILENVIMVSSGFGHILAITKEGELLSWGNNSHGQLGDSSEWSRFDPKPVFSNAKYAKAGNACSFVIDNSGQLWACGSNSNGELGIGTQDNNSRFVRVPFPQ
jgi:alpha-tubulin suppressor-like RCC1 family protein